MSRILLQTNRLGNIGRAILRVARFFSDGVSSLRLIAITAFGAVFLGACGSSAQHDARKPLSALEVHAIEQGAIRDCMAAAGFDYTPLPFRSPPGGDMLEVFLLSDADEAGYGATMSELARRFLPTGAPADNLSEVEVAAYDRALLGKSDSQDHVEEGVGGCYEVGAQSIRDLDLPEDIQPWQSPQAQQSLMEFNEKLQATAEYQEFRQVWISCMATAGYHVEDPMIQRFALQADLRPRLDAYLKANARIESSMTKFAESNGSDPAIEIDSLWFRKMMELGPGIADMFRDEIAEASTDAACRRDNSDALASRFLALQAQIFGRD